MPLLPRPTHHDVQRDRWVLAVAAVSYLPLTFLGFGADNDSYEVVEMATRLGSTGVYQVSRNPGFLVHELGAAVLIWLGGSVASNLGSAAMALLAVGSFLGLCRRWAVPHRHVLALTFALHPFVWVNAASTMDYLWALGLALAGAVLLVDRRWLGAGLLLGLAIGARLSTVLLVASLVGFALAEHKLERRGIAVAALVAFGLGGLCYVPSLVAHGGTLGFLAVYGAEEQATWTWAERLGRVAYKNLYLWGLPTGLLIAGLGVRAVPRRTPGLTPAQRRVFVLCLAVVGAYEALYVRYPLEQEYLIPIIPFVLVGLGLSVGRRGLVALFALVLAYNAVSVNLARPDRPNWAQSVEVGVWVEPGYLVADIRQRLRMRGCLTAACWMERWNEALSAPEESTER